VAKTLASCSLIWQKQLSLQFMHTRLIIAVIAGFGLVTPAFEAIAVQEPSAVFKTSGEVILRLSDGRSVFVGGKLAALLADGASAGLRKNYDRAILSYTAALQANPDKNVAFFIYSWRAAAYSQKGELGKALTDSTAAIQLNPKSALAYFERGHAYRDLGESDKAIGDYTAAIELDPKRERAYYNRAIVYRNSRQYALAIRDSTTAIQLNPRDADAYHNRGVYYFEIGAFDEAISDFSQAMRFNPRNARTFLGRAGVYEDIGRLNEAMADYGRATRITPKDANDYALRGSAYFQKGNYKGALSDFEKALRLSPINGGALNGLAWLRATCPEASLRNGKEAIRMSRRACEVTKSKEPDDILTLAAAYAETRDFDQAVKYQAQGIKMKSAYGPVDKKARERLALYQAHKPARAEPLVSR
jgi:tetratricopeptide (TPR) repeat protein